MSKSVRIFATPKKKGGVSNYCLDPLPPFSFFKKALKFKLIKSQQYSKNRNQINHIAVFDHTQCSSATDE